MEVAALGCLSAKRSPAVGRGDGPRQVTLSSKSRVCQMFECLLMPGHQEGPGASVADREVKEGLRAAKRFSARSPCQESQVPLELYRCWGSSNPAELHLQ